MSNGSMSNGSMSGSRPEVLVIGAGVSGLSSALALLDAGCSVRVRTASLPHRTTSAAAGALWGAHLVGSDDRVGAWGLATLDRFRELTAEPAAGISEIYGTSAALDPLATTPDYAIGMPGLAAADPSTLPAGYVLGWRYLAPVITMPVYLDYLLDQVVARGGLVQLGQPFADLAEAAAATTAPVIVNCTGIGAGALAGDPGMTPVRGQVVMVANPGLTEFFVGERAAPGEITYLFPHGPVALLGGTEVAGDARTEPDPDVAERILRGCIEVEPRLAQAPVLAHRVGLRPVRPHVRLESETLPGGRQVVHNYGHGGAGVTLSWGCALSVRDEVSALLR